MDLLLFGQLKTTMGDKLYLAVILFSCISLEALLLVFLMRRRPLLRAAAAVLSFAFALTAFSLSYPDTVPEPPKPAQTQPLTEDDPRDTVEAFLNAIRKGDYPAAYACLSEYESLGLEDEPEGEAARLLADALRGSYSFLLRGGAVVEGLDARQSVSLTALDLNAMTPDLEREAEAYLLMLSDEVPRSRLAYEDGHFLPSISGQAYLYVLRKTLEHRDDYLCTHELELRLVLTTEGWRIVVDQPLLDALGGQPPADEGGRAP